MEVLLYALPYFLMQGETFQYTKNNIDALSKLVSASSLKFNCIKEKQFKNIIMPLKETIVQSHETLKKEVMVLVESSNNIYHCMHNGFSIPNIKICKYIATIYSVIPITNKELIDIEYCNYYIEQINKVVKLSNIIIVPCNYIKRILKEKYNLHDKRIKTIYPCIDSDLKGKPKEISKIYVRDKFNINTDYILFLGELNNRCNLKEELYMYYKYNHKNTMKFVISVSYLNKNIGIYKKLLSKIESLNLTNDIILLNNTSYTDKVNLINAANILINLNRYNELSTSMLMCIALKTRILCYGTECNFEMLEDYPTYYEDNMILEEVVNCDSNNLDEDMFIIDKYDDQENIKELFNVYEGLLNEVEESR